MEKLLSVSESGMLQDLKTFRGELSGEPEAAPVVPEGVAEVTLTDEPTEPLLVTGAEPAAEETLIRIGDQEFKTQAEAIKYAETLVREKEVSDAYTMGIRETLDATAPATQAQPEEDNFEEQFYADPKATLAKVRKQAADDALQIMDAREREKAAWVKFQTLNPDLADAEPEVRRILAENIDVLGKMKDQDKAMALLATKTRTYFQAIADRMKPRTEMTNKGAQVVSSGGSRASVGVTPKKDEEPLDLVSQMKRMRIGR